ncbi:MAG: hypothetical protein H0U52_12005 [Chloroflexi bacterium]|nr:hypothetical protein [Chloroflexota bacterium]
MSMVFGSSASQTLVRALAVVVIIGAFVATQQIETGQVDTLAWAGLVVASISAAAVALQLMRQPNASVSLADGLGTTGVTVGAVLVAIGIFRTVFKDAATPYSDAVLGVGLVVLLVLTFWMTERRRQPAAAPAAVFPVAGAPGAGAALAAPASPPPPAGTSGEGTRRLTVLGSLVALVVVIGYAAIIAGLWVRSGAADAEWARLIGLQSGIQAAAFAALGALIGVTIQGQAVGAAQDDAAKAREAAGTAAAGEAAATAQVGAAQAAVESHGEVLDSADQALGELERMVADRAVPSSVREDTLALGVDELIRDPSRLRHVGRVIVADEDDALLEKIRATRDDLRVRRRSARTGTQMG